jgi:hypothetical protein
MAGLPIEGWVGLACGVLFVVVLACEACRAWREADVARARDMDALRAEQLAAEAERWLATHA